MTCQLLDQTFRKAFCVNIDFCICSCVLSPAHYLLMIPASTVYFGLWLGLELGPGLGPGPGSGPGLGLELQLELGRVTCVIK